MKSFLKSISGILIGALYALILRLIFSIEIPNLVSLFSITFIWLVPAIIGSIPLFYATDEQLKNIRYRMTSPVWTVVLFFILCFVTRMEDLICICVIAIPYVLGAMVVGIVAGEIIEIIRLKRNTLYSIILIPFIVSPIEQQFKPPTHSYSVVTQALINAKAEEVWQHIIRVSQIEEKEYSKGFFNYAGIPRPLFAELDKDTLGATRVGHFEGGLKFVEKVISWDRNKHIGFDISVVPSSIRRTVFDQHILKGGHFRFLNANYYLKQLPNGQTELTLSSSYELSTNINSYAAFCGNQLLEDFQQRLLQVIKTRCNHSS